MAARRYRYSECGLGNVVLANGFRFRSTPYGKAVAIDRIDELHRAIGTLLVEETKALSGRELRFLRHEMKLSQNRLATLLGVDEQTVARWEKGQVGVSGPGDKMIRILYRETIGAPRPVRAMLHHLAELDTHLDRDHVFEARKAKWRPARAV